MGAMDEPLVEMWSLYALGNVIIILRIACRWKMVGIQGLKPDDYSSCFALVIYAFQSLAADICSRHADLHSLSLEERSKLSDEEAAPYIHATQWFSAGVSTYVAFVWCLKFNMLFFYQRVVNGLWVEKFIKPVMALVAATGIIIMIILFASCRPYSRMWQVYPDQGDKCEPQSAIYLLPALVLNILTDICIMAIPAPVIFPVKTTIWRKISLIVIFSASIFIMVAAVLRVDMVLVAGNGSTAAIWSFREDFVAICVGQAPILRPVFTRRFWTGEMSSGGSRSRTTKASLPIQSGNDAFEMNSSKKHILHSANHEHQNYNVTIMSTRQRNSDSESTDRIMDGGIVVDTWVDVESQSVHQAAGHEAGEPGLEHHEVEHQHSYEQQVKPY